MKKYVPECKEKNVLHFSPMDFLNLIPSNGSIVWGVASSVRGRKAKVKAKSVTDEDFCSIVSEKPLLECDAPKKKLVPCASPEFVNNTHDPGFDAICLLASKTK